MKNINLLRLFYNRFLTGKLLIIIALFFGVLLNAQTKYPEINKQIKAGNFSKAERLINEVLSGDKINTVEKYDLNFQIDKMHRIMLDFNKTDEDINSALKKYYPNLNKKMIESWEADKSLEMKFINGKKYFFRNAVPNLFRINLLAKKHKKEVDGIIVDPLKVFLKAHIPEWINESRKSKKVFANPVTMKITYTLTVDSNAVPAGEVIRCWLPYPREDFKRQTDIKLLAVNAKEYIIASDSNPQRTLYMEKTSQKGKPTVFQIQYKITDYSEIHNIDPQKIKPYDSTSDLFKEYTSERSPHIVFTNQIKELSKKIIGNEKNPYEKIKKIYTWINENIPWASAREYSTINNISSYCLNNKHGDCGIVTLTFMTLARYNGIPCRWQSGWMLHPGQVNLHDWCEVYLNGYGWVPLDQSFGIQNSDDPKVEYFYIGGIDPYRLIVNDDYGKSLFPAKIYPRSETNDFQRGEVEWRGGNLYFNKWVYNMNVQYLK
ncbi:MAG TPA: transglutaminase-like domain-containing protein [Ignavibacteriaceae bacterium]|nr:transglutaminase-like domain-containing protein [Ignavibacteriaceae bacterium]